MAFFYDMNSIGNRHVGNNIRLMVINNGRGTEFRMYNHKGARFGEDADDYIAAAGHFGDKSSVLIKQYAEALGFEYLSANDKESYLNNLEQFTNPSITDKPILFEVFTDTQDENEALRIMRHLVEDATVSAKRKVVEVLGRERVDKIKSILKR